ncbi:MULTISPECIES: hypothetical protein [unclassified Shewanella]|uniref:hypothetical protein n=1 Tax=Shewanella TaxID=22 RepID=UPI0021D83D8A|nr:MULTISPECIES: hypothetical protein [unclassified Shewanella]MCU7977324.1 hypothetical protein [Shewanella sp. SW36]MCU7992581.1 hypothetical protein [Shewanella sp. SW1]MCU8053692.1 hypothetical protein [Shewanella sp. SM43]
MHQTANGLKRGVESSWQGRSACQRIVLMTMSCRTNSFEGGAHLHNPAQQVMAKRSTPSVAMACHHLGTERFVG